MDFIRIGDKLIDPGKIQETVLRVLKMRSEGLSQQEVARKMRLDRTFISRLETMGSIRRGGRLGLLAFPVENKDELLELADRYGIEQRLVLSNRERWHLVEQLSGLDFLNQVMTIIEQFRQCDTVLVLCSSKWSKLAEALLDNQIIVKEIGTTPIQDNIYVNPREIEEILQRLL
jgi:transcriptional regulator with XRE-family HTH domain